MLGRAALPDAASATLFVLATGLCLVRPRLNVFWIIVGAATTGAVMRAVG